MHIYICNIFVCSTYVNISISCVYLFWQNILHQSRLYISYFQLHIIIYIYIKSVYKCMWIEKRSKVFQPHSYTFIFISGEVSPPKTHHVLDHVPRTQLILVPKCKIIHILMILQTMFFHFQTSNQIQKTHKHGLNMVNLHI